MLNSSNNKNLLRNKDFFYNFVLGSLHTPPNHNLFRFFFSFFSVSVCLSLSLSLSLSLAVFFLVNFVI